MKSALKELETSRETLFSQFRSGKVLASLQEEYSEIIDQYFRVSIQESETGQAMFNDKVPFALLAVGGYGRKELCLFSDIDILIIFNRKIPDNARALAEGLFYPLWDLGLELGYGVRTIGDCLKLCRDDFEVFTSILDGRFLCGDSTLYLNLMEGFHGKVVKKKAPVFERWLEGLDKIRMKKFGDASHLLEPNLKEGIGGLRDYHHILWLAKALFSIRDPRELEYLGHFSHNEYRELESHVGFILLVRNYLHQLSGRKNDRLSFEYQEEIASNLGYRREKKIPAVERFLGVLHSSMETIKTLYVSFVIARKQKKTITKNGDLQKELSKGLRLYNGEIGFHSAGSILADPFILMEIFAQSSLSGYPLSIEARRLVKEFSYLVDDQFKTSEKTVGDFRQIINGTNTTNTLDQMCDTGFLDAFIPEFGRIRDRVQFDAYHIFPVGRHILMTLSYLKNISKEKNILLLDTFSDLEYHEPLLLAGLFHDIGKTGNGHSRRGARIARKILDRFHYSEQWTEEILFLIENHLLLAETASRRDLNDEKVIVQCARIIGNIHRLKSLYLLTWADSKATGPGAWNEWIGNLVQELFFKILHILEGGELATPDSSQRVKRVKSKIKRETSGLISHDELERLFEVMSPRYLLNISPGVVMRHLEMVERLKEKIQQNVSSAFLLDIREDKRGGAWEVHFVAKDRPGLFSDIAGVMALNNINILATQIYTWRDGTVVDIFSVTRPLDSLHMNETWERVEKNLTSTFGGRLSLPYRLSQKAAPTVLSTPRAPVRPPEVVIDNKSSDFFTIIEVFASDRVGLLYLITRTLFDLRLDIRVAKTGVKGDQIADVFYVRDLDGQKLEDEAQVNELKNALLYQLSQ